MVLMGGYEKDGMQIAVYNKQQINIMHIYFEGTMSCCHVILKYDSRWLEPAQADVFHQSHHKHSVRTL